MAKSLIQRFKDLFSSSTVTSTVLGTPFFSAQNYANFVKEGYAKNPVLFACMDYIQNCVAGLKWNVYDDDEYNTKRKKFDNHELLDLIRKPDPSGPRSLFSKKITLHMFLEGDAFIFKNAPTIGKGAGRPRELNILRPDLVTLQNGRYYYRPSVGKEIIYQPDQILRISFYHPLNDWDGFSPLQAAAQSVDVSNSGRKWNYSLLRNSIKLGTWLEAEGGISERLEVLKEKLKSRFAGEDNAGETMILTNGLTVKQGSFAPKDMDWGNLSDKSALEIMQVLHFPPEILGISANRTFSNYAEARKSLYEETIIPFTKYVRDWLNFGLADIFGAYLDFDVDSIGALQEDVYKKEDRVTRKYSGGIILLSEARAELGYAPLKKGQEEELYTTPINYRATVPDTTVGKSKGLPLTPEVKARNRRRYQMVEAYRSRFDKYFAGVVRGQFESEQKRIIPAVKDTTPAMAVQKVNALVDDEFSGEWAKILAEFYTRVINTIGKQEMEHVLSLKKSAKGDPPKFDMQSDAVRRRIRDQAVTRVKNISEGTKRILKRHIEDGIEEGDSIEQIADRLNTVYEISMIPNRAEMIAQTETISTTNFAGQEVAKQSGLKLKKQWISTLDGRTRGSDPKDEFDHVHMDGVDQEMEQPYDVSGERMMFPGDSALGASAGNTINCRCAEGYIVVE